MRPSWSKAGFGTLVLGGTNSFTSTQINAGVLSISGNPNLGDTLAAGGINFAATPSATAAPATLLITSSLVSARPFTTSAAGTSGTIDVASGVTFTSTGVISQFAAPTGSITKAGLGTLFALGTNTVANLAISGGGAYISTGIQPFGTAAVLAINGGTLGLLQQNNPTASVAVATTGNISYGGEAVVPLAGQHRLQHPVEHHRQS